MSFLNIKNLDQRDRMVAEYQTLKKKLRERNLAERVGKTSYRKFLEEAYEPASKSGKEMAEKISQELKPIKQGLNNINSTLAVAPRMKAQRELLEKLMPQQATIYSDDDDDMTDDDNDASRQQQSSTPARRRWRQRQPIGERGVEENPLLDRFLERYFNPEFDDDDLDRTYGLRRVGANGVWKIGKEEVSIDRGNNLYLGGELFA